MDDSNITVQVDAPPEAWEPIQKRLRAYNESKVGPWESHSVVLRVHDDKGELIGGVLGWLTVGWLIVDTVWVDERLRHAGLGSKLLRRLEGVALERGFRRARLNTSSWQARGFYEKQGYTVFAQLPMTLENAPGGTEQVDYFMRKDLKSTAAE